MGNSPRLVDRYFSTMEVENAKLPNKVNQERLVTDVMWTALFLIAFVAHLALGFMYIGGALTPEKLVEQSLEEMQKCNELHGRRMEIVTGWLTSNSNLWDVIQE